MDIWVFEEGKGRAMADSSLPPHWHRMGTYRHRLYPGLLPPLMSVYKKKGGDLENAS